MSNKPETDFDLLLDVDTAPKVSAESHSRSADIGYISCNSVKYSHPGDIYVATARFLIVYGLTDDGSLKLLWHSWHQDNYMLAHGKREDHILISINEKKKIRKHIPTDTVIKQTYLTQMPENLETNTKHFILGYRNKYEVRSTLNFETLWENTMVGLNLKCLVLAESSHPETVVVCQDVSKPVLILSLLGHNLVPARREFKVDDISSALAISRNGKVIAAANKDGTTIVTYSKHGEKICTFHRGINPVVINHMSFYEDTSLFVTSSTKTIHFFEMKKDSEKSVAENMMSLFSSAVYTGRKSYATIELPVEDMRTRCFQSPFIVSQTNKTRYIVFTGVGYIVYTLKKGSSKAEVVREVCTQGWIDLDPNNKLY